MNILREVRKVKEKKMSTRIILMLLFCVIFLINTYAWFTAEKKIKINGIDGDVTSWDVAYYANDEEVLDETVTFTIDELYPGMPNREDIINVYNIGKASTQIYYELLSVKVFGVEVLNQLKVNKDLKIEGTTTNLFSIDTNYPFNVSYTYDKNYLSGQYVDDETTPDSKATLNFNVSWPYVAGSTEEEIITGDILDTRFGKDAYTYYEEGYDPKTAIEIQVRITSKMVLTSDIEFKNSDINIKTYGLDGQGVATLNLREEYKQKGYYIQYVVVGEGDTLGANATWTQGDMITGLSETDTIYVRITDGIKYAEGIATINLTGLLEHYTNDYATELTQYTDTNGDTAYIPKGFKVGDSSVVNTVDNGLVIEDKNGNQFVWVPVKDVVYNETTSIPTSASTAESDKTFYRPMARYQAGSTRYYEGIFYNFVNNTSYATLTYRLGQANYSEPRIATGDSYYTWNIEDVKFAAESYDAYFVKTDLGFTTAEEFGKYMNEEYTNMINSVKKYGGFYVGRYETSLSGAVAQSKAGQTPMVNRSWTNMYKYLDSNRNSSNPYYNNSQYVSSMIWNSQWNAMLNWILTGPDAKYVSDKSIGNLSSTVSKTGETATDCINNIFDLTGNVAEWTQTAEGQSNRAYRGSGINVKNDSYREGSASNIWSYNPQFFIDNINFLGTRMALYIKVQNDTTPPTITFRNTPAVTTNSIKAKVEAQDDLSGIKNYIYSISSDGGATYTNYTAYGNTYTFENLAQNSNYYIKVKVYDHSGNVAEIAYPNVITTQMMEVQTGDIELDALYGKNGAGIAYLEIPETLTDQGCFLEYQIVKDGGTFQETGTWTQGQQINNLSVGDTIYARVTDGVNVASDSLIYTCNIAELETFSEAKTSLTEYTDVNGDKAYIPSGFRVGTSSINNTIKNGLVIENATTGDQFVWVPVEHAIYNSADGTIPTNATEANKNKDASGKVVAYKPMAKYQNGYSESTPLQYFEGIAYTSWGTELVKGSYAQRGATDYAVGNNSHREPSLVTNDTRQYTWKFTAGTEYDANSAYYSNILKFESATKLGEYMNTEYTNMILSVKKYGGFYIGRYETSYSGTTAKSQYDTLPMTDINWYDMYYRQDSNINPDNPYYGNTGIVTSMIWDSQWDAMLNWIVEGVDAKQVYTVKGNHTGSIKNSGLFGNDFANNIMDISANVYEFVQGATSTSRRLYRGNGYFPGKSTATGRHVAAVPTNTYPYMGSRFTLYIK